MLEAGRITITSLIRESGTPFVTVDVHPEDLPLVEQLGLLRLAEDVLIRSAMGELDDNEDEYEEEDESND